VLTSLTNDYGYDAVFARQVEALGRQGDIALAISTSGNSPNVLRAIETARARGMRVIGLSGGEGGKMRSLCDPILLAPSRETPRIQEGHALIYHILCGLVEREIFG
jgi:D-sedoheptulose 7-phosphate isomerase